MALATCRPGVGGVKVDNAQPNCQVPAAALQAFPGLSGYFLGLQVKTNVQTPLKGQVFVSFDLV